VVACSAPLAFTFGLGMLLAFPLRAGACALLIEQATPGQLADIVAAEHVTVLATAPTAYKAILRDGLEHKLAGLRSAVSAGEHIPQGTWERLRDSIGLQVIDGIGATELLHIFITAAGDDIRPGATGRPLPGFRAAILGPDGTELGPLQPGRLGVIGPVGCRYLDDERQRNYVTNGWNCTGDVFYKDADGYFYYQARSDNMIVSSGYNIGGPEVEAAIDTHPDVLESAVVARPDAMRGSVVCAFVVLRDGVPAGAAAAAKAKEIQDHVKQVLAPYKYPRDVRFTAALPRNASGKLQHFALRAVLEKEGVEDDQAAERKETLA
jgi:2-aminobenzoate-CoA ligase